LPHASKLWPSRAECLFPEPYSTKSSKKLPYGYEYQGEHQVKNITNPVKVYKLLTAPEDAGKMVGMEPPVSASKWIWPTVVVAAIVVTLIGYQVYQEIAGPKFEPASVEKMAIRPTG
jgi:adenylate cyclase